MLKQEQRLRAAIFSWWGITELIDYFEFYGVPGFERDTTKALT